MINCHYCGVGNKEHEGSCVRCGAPLSKKSPLAFFRSSSDYGRCVCGLEIDDEIHTMNTDIVCHGCYNTFKGTAKIKYDHDRIYKNGQLTHVYKVAGLECPHCGSIFVLHEVYHGIRAEQGVDYLIEHAKRAHAEV